MNGCVKISKQQNINKTFIDPNVLFLYIPDAMPDYSLEACKLLSNQSSKKYNLKPLNKTVANPQLKFRNLKGSSISSNQMRF